MDDITVYNVFENLYPDISIICIECGFFNVRNNNKRESHVLFVFIVWKRIRKELCLNCKDLTSSSEINNVITDLFLEVVCSYNT